MSSNGGNAIHGRRRKQDTRPATGRKVGLGAALAIVVIVALIVLF
ncbi:hypothetical protein ACX80W_13490 [Arthrobacter sp. TMN-37]